MATCYEYEYCNDDDKQKVCEEEKHYSGLNTVVSIPENSCTNIRIYREGINENGAITVEASMLLPIVIVICFSLMLFFQLLMLQTRLQSALEEAASEMALAGYIEELIPDKKLEEDSILQSFLSKAITDIAQMGIGEVYVNLTMPNKLDEAWMDKTMIGSGGITYYLSPIALEAGLIDLRAYYTFHFPGLSVFDIELCQRAVRKKWNGLGNIELHQESSGQNNINSGNETSGQIIQTEQQVYVTREGTVYHVFRDCRALKRDIKTSQLSEMQDKRNKGGGKYYACESCIRGSANLLVYYTSDGDRYHNSVSCGSLIRYISKIKISEVAGKRLCSFCAGRSAIGTENILEGF